MSEREEEAVAWQVDVWDGISQIYWDEIHQRSVPVVDGLITRAGLRPGERVLDLGTGTGAVAARAAAAVAPGGDAGVTAAGLPAEVQAEARKAIQAAMWPDAAQPRHFATAPSS